MKDEIRKQYSESIQSLSDEADNIRTRLAEITENNNKFREEQMKQATFYGSNWSDMEIDPETTLRYLDDEGKKQEIVYIVDERNELEDRLQQIEKEVYQLELSRNAELEKVDKEAREKRVADINKKGLLDEAYKFFTYLDTATTKGYNVSGLSEEEVIDLYKEFYDNREQTGYSRIWRETMDRMAEGGRKVFNPKAEAENILESAGMEIQTEEEPKKEEPVAEEMPVELPKVIEPDDDDFGVELDGVLDSYNNEKPEEVGKESEEVKKSETKASSKKPGFWSRFMNSLKTLWYGKAYMEQQTAVPTIPEIPTISGEEGNATQNGTDLSFEFSEVDNKPSFDVENGDLTIPEEGEGVLVPYSIEPNEEENKPNTQGRIR